MKHYMQYFREQRGVTLLVAVILSSVVLAIGLAIANIVFKELRLSATVRESQEAFYAADSALECALYWDLHEGVFSHETEESMNISCADSQVWVVSTGDSVTEDSFHTFSFSDINGNPFCATVEISKDGATGATTIDAFGQNTCASVALRVERGLQASY